MKKAPVFKILFSFFVLALGGFALYEYRNSALKEERGEKGLQLLPEIKLEDVKAIRLIKAKSVAERADQNKLSLIKKEEDWLLLEPLEDFASFTELSRWFNTISRHKVVALEIENPDLADYHIGKYPAVELDLKTGGLVRFSISSKSSFDGRWFVKKGNQILLAERGIDKELQDKNLEDFRSKKILPGLNHADKIKIQTARELLTLNWKDYEWFLEGRGESDLPLDQSFLNDFWTELTSLEAVSFLESSKELKKYRLNKPLLTIQLFYGEREYFFKLSPVQEGRLYATVSHRDYIFEISKDKKEELLFSKNELYDHSFPFDFESPLVSQIQITGIAKPLNLEKKKEAWLFVKGFEPEANKKNLTPSTEEKRLVKTKEKKNSKHATGGKDSPQMPDPDKIQDFLNMLKTLKGLKYKKAKEADPLQSLQLKKVGGELIFELWEMERSEKHSWVKSSLWPEWIALPQKTAEEIFDPSLLKEKEE